MAANESARVILRKLETVGGTGIYGDGSESRAEMLSMEKSRCQ